MNELKLQLLVLYQSYLDLLKRGKPVGFDWVEFYSHVVYLLESGKLTTIEYNTLLDYSKAHVARLTGRNKFIQLLISATSVGLFNNNIQEGYTETIKYWKLPLNSNEEFSFTSSNKEVFGVTTTSIVGRSSGSATLTLIGTDVTATKLVTIT